MVNTRGPADARFTFTSQDPGDHEICLSSNITGGWISTEHVKMYLDINVGSSKLDKEWVSSPHIPLLLIYPFSPFPTSPPPSAPPPPPLLFSPHLLRCPVSPLSLP